MPSAAEFLDAQDQAPSAEDFLSEETPPVKITLSPYEQAQLPRYPGGPRPETPMDPTTDLTQALFAELPRDISSGLEKAWVPIEHAAANALNLVKASTAPETSGVTGEAPDAAPYAKPGVPLLNLPLAAPGEEGVIPSLSRFAQGLTTPGNLLALPLAGEFKPIEAYFAAQAGAAIPQSIQALEQARTPAGTRGAATDLAANLLMGGLMARGLTKGPNAIHSEAKPILPDVRTQPGRGPGEVPTGSNGEETGSRGSEGATQALPEEAQVLLNDAGSIMDVPVGVAGESPRPGQFMGVNRETGSIEVYPAEFQKWLQRVPPEQRAAAVQARLGEERIHLSTSDADAGKYWDSLTGAEKLAVRRIYTGRFRDTGQFSNTELGHEAVRYRIQQLSKMDPSEIAEAATRERWTVKSLQALADLIRTIREKLGTKASGTALAILDRVQENLADGRVAEAVGGEVAQPAATSKETDATKEFRALIHSGDVRGGNALSTKAGLGARSLDDLDALANLRQTYDAQSKALLEKTKAAPADQRMNLAMQNIQLSPRVQLPREAIEVATGTGGWTEDQWSLGERPLDWRTHPEVADWLKENGPKLGIMLPDELKARPGATTKPQMQLNLTAEKGERPSASELGARAFTARDVEAAGAQHIQSKIEGSDVPDFKGFSNELRGKYGDIKPGQLFEQYQDTLYKNLFTASGDQLAALAKKLKVKVKGKIADAPQAAAEPGRENLTLEYGLTPDQAREQFEARMASKKAATAQERAEGLGQRARQRYRTGVITRISEKLLDEAAPEAKTATRTSISPEDLRANDATKQPGFFDISTQDTGSPTVLAQRLVQDARRSSRDPVSLTKRLTALVDKQSGKTYLVSTYPHGRAGAMLVDPTVASVRAHRPLSQIMSRYRPVASMLLDEPVQNFRQAFDSLGDFEAKLGTDARRMSQQTFEEPLREGQQPEPGSWEKGAPITDAEAGSILDHITAEVGNFDSVDDVKDSLAALKEDTNPQALSGYRKLSAQILRKNPDLSNEGLINQLAQQIYENHASAPDYETFVKRTMAQGAAAYREGAATGANAPAVETGQELTMRSRRPPTSVLPQNIPPEAAAQLGSQPAPPVPEGTPEGPGAFNKQAVVQAGKDEISRVGDAIKLLTSRSHTINNLARTMDQVDNRKNNDAAQAEMGVRLASASKESPRGNSEVLAAANAMIEGRFDRSKVNGFLNDLQIAKQNADQLAQSPSWRDRRLAAAYKRDIAASEAEVNYALDHWDDPELKATARRTKAALDQQYAVEKATGFDLNKEEGYIPHRLLGVWGGADTLFQLPRILGTKYRAPRTFSTHYEALAAGPYMRVTHDAASLVGHRVRQGMGNIYRHQWKDGLKAIQLPGGTPLAIDAIQGSHGFVSPDPAYRVLDTGYGPIAVHEDVFKPLRGLIKPSYFEDAPFAGAILRMEQQLKHGLLIGDFFHFARMAYYGTSIAGLDALRKPSELGQAGWSVLSIAPKNAAEAVRKGIISQRDADWANEKIWGTLTRRDVVNMAYQHFGANLGKISDALYKDLLSATTPTSGPVTRAKARVLDPTAGRYNRFLFDQMTRGLMAESIVREFERQSKAKPDASPDALLRDISRDVNERFGNLGRQGLFKSQTAQDFMRLVGLAPQWLEGMARTEGRAYARTTGVASALGQRKGVTTLGTTGYTTARAMLFMVGLTQAINYITRGKSTFQNEEPGHKLDAWIPSWGGSGEGFWFNPLSVFMELSHDLYRIGYSKIQQDRPVGETLIDVLSNKESPISRALVIMGTGRNPRGEQITSTAGRFLSEPAKAIAPLPITFGKYLQAAGHALAPGAVPALPPGQMQRQAFGTAGLKIEPALSDTQSTRRLAEKFMKDEGLKKETGWEQVQTDESSYSKLRQAIRDNDHSRAQKVYNDLLKGRTPAQISKYMRLASHSPFTGSTKAETSFVNSLDGRQLDQYSKAEQQRLEEFEKFAAWFAE